VAKAANTTDEIRAVNLRQDAKASAIDFDPLTSACPEKEVPAHQLRKYARAVFWELILSVHFCLSRQQLSLIDMERDASDVGICRAAPS
jgi:hypothetical protein